MKDNFQKFLHEPLEIRKIKDKRKSMQSTQFIYIFRVCGDLYYD